MPWTVEERRKRSTALGYHFKPSTPIDNSSLFSGRVQQKQTVVDAINQQGQHVVLYGERGVGKTSLAKMLFPSLTVVGGGPILTPHVFCDSGDTYASIWRKAFSEITVVNEKAKVGFDRTLTKTLSTVADGVDSEITPDIVRKVLTGIGGKALLVVILDEFDCVLDESVRRLTADTIKALSDRSVPATVVLIGVADDVDGLIQQHQSVERCLVQVRMPRMSREELESIVNRGLEAVDMTIEHEALQEISGLSKGLPHYTHLLALHSARDAINASSSLVTKKNVEQAVVTSIENTQQSIRSAYQKAILSTKKNAIYDKVLLACAIAETDEWGFFSPSDVREPMNTVMKKPYLLESFARHLHMFCDAERGPVLKKMGFQHRFRFRFVNALLQPYVIMRGLADGTISREALQLSHGDSDPQRKLFKS